MLDERTRSKIFNGICAFVVLTFAAFAIELVWTEQCLVRSAVEVEAVVTDKRRSGKTGQTLQIAIKFTDGSGNAVDSWQRVSAERFRSLAIGNSVAALYCPANPARNALDLSTLRPEVSRSILASAVLAFGFAAFLLFQWGKAAISRRRELVPPEAGPTWNSTANRYPRRVDR